MLATGLWHRRDQLRIGETDQRHDGTADHEGKRRAQRPRILQETAGQDDPAEADHRPERDRQDIPSAKNSVESGIGLPMAHASHYMQTRADLASTKLATASGHSLHVAVNPVPGPERLRPMNEELTGDHRGHTLTPV